MPPLISRRSLLQVLASAAMIPGLPARAADLASWFDRAMACAEPDQMLALLEGLDPAGLTEDERQDLRIVRDGLQRLIGLRRLFPLGSRDGLSPYVLSPRHGLAKTAIEVEHQTEALLSEAARGAVPPVFLLDALLARPVAPDLAAATQQQNAVLRALKNTAKAGDGVWRLPGGDDYYALRLASATGLTDGADQIRRQAGEMVAALLARADGVLQRQGLRQGTVGARLRALALRRDLLFATPADAVTAMNDAIARIKPYLPGQFHLPFDDQGQVVEMTSSERAAAKRGYRDFDKNAYYPDFHDLPARPGWTLTTSAYHEAVPGHLLQMPFQVAAQVHPLRLKFAPGYAEGWSIYAESLADDLGLFGPLEQLGYLQSMLYRLARLTVDIDIHHHRASREQALASMADLVGFALIFPFDVDIDRICIEPAGFVGDALTMMEIRRLKKAASDPRDFHAAILRRGPLPIAELNREISRRS